MRRVTGESFARLEDQDEQLLPGLSNEIVLDQIVPKLPWRAFHTLSSVSRPWLQAIRSHQVFDARARSHSTETLLLLNFTHFLEGSFSGVHGLCLYSAKEKTWHRLPDFPNRRIGEGLPNTCGFVSLDGKVYVLGGETGDFAMDSGKVYVLDLAGQTGWRQCASMIEPRQDFAHGVIDGKIYVVGGTACRRTIRRSEVYDPKDNAWSSISPMISTRYGHKFVTVGEQLWLYGGAFFKRDENKAEDDPFTSSWTCFGRDDSRHKALSPEVYCPSKGEWELVTCALDHTDIIFEALGKLHTMDFDTICVDDGDGDGCWEELYTFEFSGVEDRWDVCIEPIAAYPVNGELIALVRWMGGDDEITLIQSKGFGRENDEILWEKIDNPFSGANISPSSGLLCSHECFGPPYGGEGAMCPVQL